MKVLRILRSELSAIVGDVSLPLRALLIAFAGIWLASMWFEDRKELVFGAIFGIVAIGRGLDWIGRSQLPGRPVVALRFMEWGVLAPGVLAAAAAGAIILVAVWLAEPDSASSENRELVAALATGITAFLSGGFVSWIGDKSDSRTADRIRDHFQSKYKRLDPKVSVPGVHYFKAGSAGERWVYADEYSGIKGWGRSARAARSYGIATELENGKSGPS